MPLTEIATKALKPSPKDQKVYDGGGLYATPQNKLQDKLLEELKAKFPAVPFHYMKINATTGTKELARMDPKEMAHA